MKIDKAILQLQVLLGEQMLVGAEPIKDAIKLGIEAMKHYQEVRPAKVSKYYPLLPGETTD